MKKKTNIFFWENKYNYEKAVTLLLKEKLIVSSTDTILGFLSIISQNTIEQLNKIKKNREGKAYIILISQYEQLYNLIHLESKIKKIDKIITKFWPGPLTIIFKSSKNLPTYISPNETIAIRMPNHKYLKDVIDVTGPLISTSANQSNKPAPRNILEIESEILKTAHCIIINQNDEEQSPNNNLPSTIIDCSGSNTKFSIIREGMISSKLMEPLL